MLHPTQMLEPPANPARFSGDCTAITEREVTGSNIGPSHGLQANHCRAVDAPMLPEVLSQIPNDQEIGSVTADRAYDTRNCHTAIHCRAVHVYMHEKGGPCTHAVIPPRKNAKPWKALQRWSDRQKRGFAHIEIPGQRALAELDRLPPPKPS